MHITGHKTVKTKQGGNGVQQMSTEIQCIQTLQTNFCILVAYWFNLLIFHITLARYKFVIKNL